MKTYPPLTSYRVHLDNGTSYETDMAAGVSLQDAQDYFIGQSFEQDDGSLAKGVSVEKIS